MGSRERTFLLPRSCGTPTTGQNVPNRLSRPAVVQVESHPYLPENELLEFCKEKGIVFLAFAPLGHGIRPGPLENPVILKIARQIGKTPAQILLAWAIQRGGTFLTTPKNAARAQENFDVSAL